MVYIQRSDGPMVQFEGMTIDEIVKMLADQGLTCTEMSADDYKAAIAALPK